MATYHATGSLSRSLGNIPTPFDAEARLRLFHDKFTVGSTNVPSGAPGPVSGNNDDQLVVGYAPLPAGCRVVGGFCTHNEVTTQSNGKLRVMFDTEDNIGTETPELEFYTQMTHQIDISADDGNWHVLLPYNPPNSDPFSAVLPSDYTGWIRPNVTGAFNQDDAVMTISIMFATMSG